MDRLTATLGGAYLAIATLGALAGARTAWFHLALLAAFVAIWLALRPRGEAATPETGAAQATPRRRAIDRIAELGDVGVIQMARDGTLEFASRRARELLGIGPAPEPGPSWPPIADAIRRRSDPNATSAGSYEVETLSGTVTVNFKVHPVFDEDWAGYLVQVRDRRALDALRDDLRSAARLRALNKIHVGVAHDVRGSLNAAILNLESLSALTTDLDSGGGVPERIEVLRDELDRLRRSLEMLLEQAAPERSDRRALDLEELARAVALLLDTRAQQQGVSVELSRNCAAPVVANPDRLRSALLAIAINALEAMPDGGALRLTTGTQGSWSVLDVSDSGGGMPDSVVPRVFELHFTTKSSGTGVGLWAAQSMVEAEKGTLSVLTTSPAGTTFRLSLPRAEEA